jgi:hypothetical protein
MIDVGAKNLSPIIKNGNVMSIIAKIKNFFSVARQEDLDSSKVAELEEIVDAILNMDSATLQQNINLLDSCLKLMEFEVLRVDEQAASYPDCPIKAGVWMDGATLADCGEALAGYLSDKDLLAQQAKATDLWTCATLSVCSHYHHLVGPAMIANAAINERTGNIEYSKTAYSSILQDFECILELVEASGEHPVDENAIALESLKAAATRLVELDELTGNNGKAPDILQRIDVVFSQTK